jgi:hypothetical protein
MIRRTIPKFYPNMPKFYPNMPKFYPTMPVKFRTISKSFRPISLRPANNLFNLGRENNIKCNDYYPLDFIWDSEKRFQVVSYPL